MTMTSCCVEQPKMTKNVKGNRKVVKATYYVPAPYAVFKIPDGLAPACAKLTADISRCSMNLSKYQVALTSDWLLPKNLPDGLVI
eukprot:SAG31_NODE_8464_length_1446_cov_1.236823_1_plen_85_part_00